MAAPKVFYEQVIAMREERVNGGWTIRQLADKYGIAVSTVSNITTGHSYKDVPGPLVDPEEFHRKRPTCHNGHQKITRRKDGRSWQVCPTCHRRRNRRYYRANKAKAQ